MTNISSVRDDDSTFRPSQDDVSTARTFNEVTEEIGSGGLNLNGSGDTENSWYDEELDTGKLVILSMFSVILFIGTIGNSLTFMVMQRGTLKHSSTCFYMAMLAVADTCKSNYIWNITFIVINCQNKGIFWE